MASRIRSVLLALSIAAAADVAAQPARPDSVVSDRVKLLTRGTQWKQVAAIPMQFDTQHPQGMVKIGDDFYVSSVEIKTPTKRFPQPVDGYDRDTGEGAGHLFKFDKTGKLLADLPLGEGSIYHPGGIDYDGRNIWVPVAEYRPNSRVHRLPRRSGDDESDRSVPVQGSRGRHRAQHRRENRCTA